MRTIDTVYGKNKVGAETADIWGGGCLCFERHICLAWLAISIILQKSNRSTFELRHSESQARKRGRS